MKFLIFILTQYVLFNLTSSKGCQFYDNQQCFLRKVDRKGKKVDINIHICMKYVLNNPDNKFEIHPIDKVTSVLKSITGQEKQEAVVEDKTVKAVPQVSYLQVPVSNYQKRNLLKKQNSEALTDGLAKIANGISDTVGYLKDNKDHLRYILDDENDHKIYEFSNHDLSIDFQVYRRKDDDTLAKVTWLVVNEKEKEKGKSEQILCPKIVNPRLGDPKTSESGESTLDYLSLFMLRKKIKIMQNGDPLGTTPFYNPFEEIFSNLQWVKSVFAQKYPNMDLRSLVGIEERVEGNNQHEKRNGDPFFEKFSTSFIEFEAQAFKFMKWYSHENNKTIPPEDLKTLSKEKIADIYKSVMGLFKLYRGLNPGAMKFRREADQ
jgi:hypothetical protein